MSTSQIGPEFNSDRFNCRYCRALSAHYWVDIDPVDNDGNEITMLEGKLSICHACRVPSLWLNIDRNWSMVWPERPATFDDVPEPNSDLNEDVAGDYREAASIVNQSPRGAAALLRLCVQKLCVSLGLPGKDLNSDISELVKMGLRPEVQQALDVLRVVGNEAVHPGTMQLDDDVATARALFVLINRVAESLITAPRETREIYQLLPETKRRGIDVRDKR